MNEIIKIKDFLKNYNGKEIKIMEVCGTHTSAIVKNGLNTLLSDKIKLISGPGCPVCVTPSGYIDKLIEYSFMENHCILSFGDMLKVTGKNNMSLTKAKAQGGAVEVLYSPLQAINLAIKNPSITYIFAAVGFETTASTYVALLEEIIENDIKNIKLLTSLKTMPEALSFICETENDVDGFICPGHVSVIIGSEPFLQLSEKYNKPFVITGFQGEHILITIYEIINEILNKKPTMKNFYPSSVKRNGNENAKILMDKYFIQCDTIWRGIGNIKNSGLKLKGEYSYLDAGSENLADDILPHGCRCADVILGRITAKECGLFSNICTPKTPVGPCMVSSEGACGIWYNARR